MTPEHKQKLAEGRERKKREREEARARGEELPVTATGLRARQQRARDTARDPIMRKAMTESPEFKAALKEALDAALPAMLAAVVEANGRAVDASPEAYGKALALQLAKFTGQEVGKKYVDPEVLEKRAIARGEMMALLRKFRDTGVVPAYKVIQPTQLEVPGLGPIVIEPLWRGQDRVQRETEIDYMWIPNAAMVPINDPAKQVWKQFEIFAGMEMPEVAGADALPTPTAFLAPQLGQIALTPQGNVVRGSAAAAILRNIPEGQALPLAQEHAGPSGATAVIRRGDDPAVRKRQVLGTLTEPIEMR